MPIKKEIFKDSESFTSIRRERYIDFVDQLQIQLIGKEKEFSNQHIKNRQPKLS